MHTNSEVAKRHRWFVALPLLLVMLGVTLHEGWKGTTADLLEIPLGGRITVAANAPAQTIALPDGIIQIDPGTTVDLSDVSAPVLMQGSATIVTRGLQHLHAGMGDMEGWNGGFHVIVQDKDVTIAALTTPVFFKTADGDMLVPASMQWKTSGIISSLSEGIDAWFSAHMPQSLPAVYLEQELSVVNDLSSAIRVDIPSVDASATLISHLLQLPASRERSDAALRMSRLAVILGDLQKGDASSLQSAIASTDAAALFSSPEGKEILPILLMAASSIGKQDLLLSYFLSDSDRLLLAEFHPAVRSHAWVTVSSSALTNDDVLLGILLLPLSDTIPEAMDAIAVSHWQQTSAAFLHARSDAPTILASLIPAVGDAVRRDALSGYPERAGRYASALGALAQPYLALLSDASRAALAAALSAAETKVPLAASVVTESSSASSTPSLSIADLEARTQESLVNAGFMFTAHTSMHGNGERAVDVSSVVLGTPGGDQSFDFTYEPIADEVRNIEQGGMVLPYSLTLMQYVAWAKGSH